MKLIWSAKIPGRQVTTNKAYPTSRQGRRFLSKGGKAYKALIADIAGYTYAGKVLTCDLHIEIEYTFPDRRRRDFNNYDKIICDALQGIIYEDDSQIIDGRFKKNKEPSKEPNTIIKIYAYEKNDNTNHHCDNSGGGLCND